MVLALGTRLCRSASCSRLARNPLVVSSTSTLCAVSAWATHAATCGRGDSQVT